MVNIGGVPLGGDYPIRIQSMTNTDTMDTHETVEQAINMIERGCEYVRITAQGIKEAEQLAVIQKELRKSGFQTPLIADIHFNPQAAEIAARIVSKIRINPGNYVDKKQLTKIDYSEQEYREELERIAERIFPLLKICQEHGTAMRIGTNHGSLSDRIMSRYGDTPLGMAESAMEFIRICQSFNYHDLVLSMKSSNIKVTANATRLLVAKMTEEGMNYPIHLGVTEAGNDDEGRIKSAAGIGALLEDGIGDTIRVSLTEDPEEEIPVAIAIADRFNARISRRRNEQIAEFPTEFARRQTFPVDGVGGDNTVRVVTTCMGIAALKCYYFNKPYFTPDFFYNPPNVKVLQHPPGIKEITPYNSWSPEDENTLPLFDVTYYHTATRKSLLINLIRVYIGDLSKAFFRTLSLDHTAVLVFESNHSEAALELREMFRMAVEFECHNPIIIKRSYGNLDPDLLQLYASIDFATLLIDGLGDGIWIEGNPKGICKFPTKTAFGILQATGTRITSTEYIACPSCGRTRFNIQEALNQVKERTSQLRGLKIAVMGCIVNGPGEMADAHYGYVGVGDGKVNLYKGKNLVKRSIPEAEAVDDLIGLIKENGDWQE